MMTHDHHRTNKFLISNQNNWICLFKNISNQCYLHAIKTEKLKNSLCTRKNNHQNKL